MSRSTQTLGPIPIEPINEPASRIMNSRWKDKWALVTGATSGIGRAMAEALAARGVHLVLTGRRVDRLQSAATELAARYDRKVVFFQSDLSDRNAPNDIWNFTESKLIDVDILVNNAGLLEYGSFVESDIGPQLQMINVHCLATVCLSRLYLPKMVARNSGDVLIVATTTLVPAPYLSTYAATKGFLLLFSEGIREEVGRYGVNVSALCAGPTESELHARTNVATEGKSGVLQSAEEVAVRALNGLYSRRARIHPSFLALLFALLPRLLPRSTISGGAEQMYRPARKH